MALVKGQENEVWEEISFPIFQIYGTCRAYIPHECKWEDSSAYLREVDDVSNMFKICYVGFVCANA